MFISGRSTKTSFSMSSKPDRQRKTLTASPQWESHGVSIHTHSNVTIHSQPLVFTHLFYFTSHKKWITVQNRSLMSTRICFKARLCVFFTGPMQSNKYSAECPSLKKTLQWLRYTIQWFLIKYYIVTQYEMFVCILSQYKIYFNSTKFSAIFFFNKQTKS